MSSLSRGEVAIAIEKLPLRGLTVYWLAVIRGGELLPVGITGAWRFRRNYCSEIREVKRTLNVHGR